MTSVNFATSSSVTVDSFVVNPVGASDGQTLIYDGTDYSPNDIVPVGTIEMWAGLSSAIPHGWLLCDGSSYSWSQYTRLRDVIGIAYGGTVDTSWNTPDLLLAADTFAAPIGLAAGSTRGNDTYTFPSSSYTSHTHTHSTAQFSSQTSSSTWSHQHSATSSTNAHNHTMNASNWPHEHNTGVPSGGHSHNYQRGTSGAGNTGITNHGVHNVSNNNHSHSHTTPDGNGGSHGHGSNSSSTEHSHNWTVSGVVSNTSTSSSHDHTINVQPIYFIIKY